MGIVHDGLKKEFEYVTREGERIHLVQQFDSGDIFLQEIAYNLITGNHLEVDRLTKEGLANGYEANTILDGGLVAGMSIVGVKFRDNIIFVPEVLISARAMKAGMAHIEPILSESGIEPLGTIIMGTVKGDLHDIGKNLCIMMLRGAGFSVHDLGVDTKPDEFIEAVSEHDAQIVGMSALLTTTMPNMGVAIEALEEAGLRNQVKVMLGGAPVTKIFAEDMGADGYGDNAIECVDQAKLLLGIDKDSVKLIEKST